ncbi:hypothetical protein Ccrd_016757, partial [Cynara cardunculus var. scolymus]
INRTYAESKSNIRNREKEELSALKAGLKKVRIFMEYVSIRAIYLPFDSRSLDKSEEGESNESKENDDSTFRISFSYGTLAYANCTRGSPYEDNVDYYYYYNNHKSDVEDPKRSILPRKNRTLNIPKTKHKPLSKKAYAEKGGDDIDFHRYWLSSNESL